MRAHYVHTGAAENDTRVRLDYRLLENTLCEIALCYSQVPIASDSYPRTPPTSGGNYVKWASSSMATMTHPSCP